MKNLKKSTLQQGGIFAILSHVVAKSTIERGNSFYSAKANNSTPKACFFICSFRTPQERLKMAYSSMMACNGQGYALDCFPLLAVFPPRCTLSPYTVESVNDSLLKISKGLSAMIYKFLTTTTEAKRLRISIFANSIDEALRKCQFTSRPLLIARLNPETVKKTVNPTGYTAKNAGGIYA